MAKIYAKIERGIHDVEPISIQFDDYSTVELVTSPYGDGIAIFKSGTGDDLSATNMPTGTAAVSGNILTTKPIASLVSKNFYILTFVVKVNGTSQQKHGFVWIDCVDEKSGLMRKR